MRIQNLPLLLRVVESVFGKRVLTYTECTELSQAILRKTGTPVHVSTLRRLFGLVPSTHSPSAHVLHTLARYCGYASVDELIRFRQERDATESKDENLLQYLILLFKDTEVPHTQDVTYLNLVRHTIGFLNQEPQLMNPFQRAIAQTKNGQDFYFEQFFNIDRLAGFYGEGLLYYLAEKKTPQAQIFGHALLANRAWLVMNDALFRKHAEAMCRYSLDSDLHPLNSGRYFGIRLLQRKLEGIDPQSLLSEARNFLAAKEKEEKSYRQAPHFELTFTTNLVLAGEWEEVKHYCALALKKFSSLPGGLPDGEVFHGLYLFQGLAFALTGEKEEAGRLHQKIDVHRFYFLAKKYLTIFYLHLGALLKKRQKTEPQLQHLVAETGFTRLLTLPSPAFTERLVNLNKDEHLP